MAGMSVQKNKLLFNQNKKVISILSRSRVGVEREKISKIPWKWFQFQITQHSFSGDISWAFWGSSCAQTTFCLTLFMARHVLLSKSKISLRSESLSCICDARRIMDSWTAKKKERHKKKNDNFVASNLSLCLLAHSKETTDEILCDFIERYAD